ncbi:MAG: DoxX family protein [Muribaculaceae bacterium]|nr:DoxX family protein [Muribaculaceae bacterium]
MSAGAPWWKIAAVWSFRIVAGVAFVVSGWAKAVDPRGFVYKLQEYLAVWHIDGVVNPDILAIFAVALSVFEFVTGILLVTGSLRRSAPVAGLLLMAVMLPLTAYIVIADPVSDCGCFGDLIVLGNTATFVKNIVITAALIMALLWYKAALPLYRPGLQWLVGVLAGMYAITIAVIGWQLQPIVDFRPYGLGQTLVADDGEGVAPSYIYSKDGEDRIFSLDELPDSTWTFVAKADKSDAARESIAVFDGDIDVTAEILAPDDSGKPMLLLVVTEPGVDNLVRSRLANELARYAANNGIRMVGLVALSGDALDQWIEMARPEYDIYSSSDTSLKQLVRGQQGLVMLDGDGRVVWKRNFATIAPDILEQDAPLQSVFRVDDGRVAFWLTIFLAAGLSLLFAISALTRLNLRPKRKIMTHDSTND